MKSLLTVFVAALVFGTFGFGLSSTNAKVETLAERFGADKALTVPESGVYNFDVNHSSIGFKVTHMGLVQVPGYFKDFKGFVNYDAADVTKSSVEFTAKTASVDTRVERRDNHLRTADFFDVENHPEMTFKSTSVESKDGRVMVTGDFTLRGKTKSITFPVNVVGFKDGRGGSKTMGVTATTKIMRSEFDVNFGIANGSVSDEVTVELNIEAGSAPKIESK